MPASIPFTVYTGASTGSDTLALTNALFAPGSGITASSVVLKASGQPAVNFYDGSLPELVIGGGLLLTSGTTPGTSNTVGWFGTDNSIWPDFYNGDADIDAVVNTVFQTQSYDATTLEFDFTVADPTATSVSFDLVFGSDEYPEWVDQFVDSAIVMVNGVNYALFNHDPLAPLSVVSSNLAAGYFQDNAGNAFPIEYDGISHVLKIVAPINPGSVTNHIKIGIADTGDHIYDSGVFLANFVAGNIPGSGVVSTPTTGTSGIDNLTGTAQAEYFDLQGGNDTCYAGAGDDIVVAGSGDDTVYGGSGADQMKGDAGNDYLDGGADADTAVYSGASASYSVAAVGGGFTITDIISGSPEGADTLVNVEFAKFSDGLFSIGAGGVLTPVGNPATPPANTAGSVVISGVGSVGKTLTATVSDPDGIAGAVSYQWQVSSGGGGWNNVGADSNTYTVQLADVGNDVQVIATYTDVGIHVESPVSAAKAIQQTNNGDLNITLIQLDAPVGASVINPLTTLLQDAIELGLSPNQAAIAIKTVLNLPAEINLPTYEITLSSTLDADGNVVWLMDPNDATALAVEKVAVQVAILTSLSDDDLGTNLTLKILEAAANNQTLDLANADDLANILGVPLPLPANKNDYPQPLREIFDRNDNIAQAANAGDIEAEWQDFLTAPENKIPDMTIADLSSHVNQAPTGSATANLASGDEDIAYTVSASDPLNPDLLDGFGDPDGGTLSVSSLSTDHGTVTDNVDGTFTITPTLNYHGPVELTYTVLDGQGGSTLANQMFVIAPVNDAPTGDPTAVLGAGIEDTAYTVSVIDLLDGFTDVDGDTLSVSGLIASNGIVNDNGDGTFTITPTLNFSGDVTLTYNVDDGNGGSIVDATRGYTLDAVNDAPTGAPTAILLPGHEDTAYTVSAAALLDGFSDVDGDTLSVLGLIASNGIVNDNGDGTFSITPTLNFSGAVTLTYNVDDGNGGSIVGATRGYTLVATPGVTLTGTGGADILNGGVHDDTLNGLAGNDTLNGLGGNDTMVGGTGNDIYYVDSAGDVVTEDAGSGTDLVLASVSYTLAADVENLLLTGAAAINGTGNALANSLTGNNGDNVLDGGNGNDMLTGGAGNDALSGGAGSDGLIGGAGNDALDGGSGSDKLDGGAGNDTLDGGDGNDMLTGGLGADTYRFDTALSVGNNVDKIYGFLAVDDTIQLDHLIFGSVAAGVTADNFRASAGGTAGDLNDFILYDTASGALYYDADGSGAGVATQFATLVGVPVVTAADFIVI